jgi:opacity protein-like surface antigen
MYMLLKPTFKLLAVTSAVLLATTAVAANSAKNVSKKDFPLNEREKAEAYNVAIIFGLGSSLNSGILGEVALNDKMSAGIILGLDGGFGMGVRLENGFRGVHKTGIFAAATGDFRWGRDRWYNNSSNTGDYYYYGCDRYDIGGKAVIGYQYLNETGFSASAGIGAGVTAYDRFYCSAVEDTDYIVTPVISTEFSIGYNFAY